MASITSESGVTSVVSSAVTTKLSTLSILGITLAVIAVVTVAVVVPVMLTRPGETTSNPTPTPPVTPVDTELKTVVTYQSNDGVFPAPPVENTYSNNTNFISPPTITVNSVANLYQGGTATLQINDAKNTTFSTTVTSYEVNTGTAPENILVELFNNMLLIGSNFSGRGLIVTSNETTTAFYMMSNSLPTGLGSWTSNAISPAANATSSDLKAFLGRIYYPVKVFTGTSVILRIQFVDTNNTLGAKQLLSTSTSDGQGTLSFLQTTNTLTMVIVGLPGDVVTAYMADDNTALSNYTAHDTTATYNIGVNGHIIADVPAFVYSDDSNNIFYVYSKVEVPSQTSDWNTPIQVVTADSNFANDSGRQMMLLTITVGSETRPILLWANHDGSEYWITFMIASDTTGATWGTPAATAFRVGGDASTNNQRLFRAATLPSGKVAVVWIAQHPLGDVYYAEIDGDNPDATRRVIQVTDSGDIAVAGVGLVDDRLGVSWSNNDNTTNGTGYVQVSQSGYYSVAQDTQVSYTIKGQTLPS